MSGDSSPSFIPKRTPKKQQKKSAVRHIYALAYISYIVFFGGLIVSAGVFAYKLQLSSELVKNQEVLVAERDKFSEAEMTRILELEKRTDAAMDRVVNNVSMDRLFEIVEVAVAETIGFSTLTLTRTNNTAVEVVIGARTESFDSVLFQRRVLQNNDLIASIDISDIEYKSIAPDSPDSPDQSLSATDTFLGPELEFNLGLNIPNANILFDPGFQVEFVSPVTRSESDVLGDEEDDSEEPNEDPVIDIISNEPSV